MRVARLMLLVVIITLLVTPGCAKKAETPTEHPLHKQFVKLIDTYVNALKKGDVKTLSETVSDSAYAIYAPGQMEKQKAYFGEVKGWKIDETEPIFINTDANQAIYRIILDSNLRRVTLDVDMRPYFNFGWRIYAIKPVKIQRKIPDSHSKKYSFPTGSEAIKSDNETGKNDKDAEKNK